MCWWRVALRVATPRTSYVAYVKEIITSIAPEDGHVSPKHVELK